MSQTRPAAPWRLRCPWCPWYVVVGARGMRGNDPGAGVEAANIGREHAKRSHGKTWAEFLAGREETGGG